MQTGVNCFYMQISGQISAMVNLPPKYVNKDLMTKCEFPKTAFTIKLRSALH